MSGFRRVRAKENDPVQMRRALMAVEGYLGGSEANLAMLMQSLLKHTNVIPPGSVTGEQLAADVWNQLRSIATGAAVAATSGGSSVTWESDQNILANQIFGS